jgi:hypothetical protein
MLASEKNARPIEDDSIDFDWRRDAADIVLNSQPATAVYENPRRQIVIRQEAQWPDDEDTTVLIDRVNLQAFIDRLCDIAGIPAIGGP